MLATFAIVFYNPYPKRIMRTRMSLDFYRNAIEYYYKNNNCYPDSIYSLKDIINIDNHPLGFGEYISTYDGNYNEVNILNGNGGWYYNSKNGEIRINLTKNTEEYLKVYFGEFRNKIPSKW